MAVMTVSTTQPSQSYQTSLSTQDAIIPSPSQVLRNQASLKTLLANPASSRSSTKSPPPLTENRNTVGVYGTGGVSTAGATRNVASQLPFIPPPPPPPLSMGTSSESPRYRNQVEPITSTTSASSTPNLPPTPLRSISSSASSPSRPSPRFHIANPTEDSGSLPLRPPPSRKTSLSKFPDVGSGSRPLPTPNASGVVGSDGLKRDSSSGDIASRSPSPPFIHINTSNLRTQPTYYHSHSSPSTTNTTSPSPFSSVTASSIPTSISPTSSMGYVAPKPLARVSLPIGPSTMHAPPSLPMADLQPSHSGRSTPVSSVSPRSRLRPLPIPPPLSAASPPPASTSAALVGPRPRSHSRGPRSGPRKNSSVGRAGDTPARPQLSFDPTSSSYVITTNSNGTIGNGSSTHTTPNATSKSRRSAPAQYHHNRSRSAQFNSFSAIGTPDANSIAAALVRGSANPTCVTDGGADSDRGMSAKQKGKLPIHSAPSSDTEADTPPRQQIRRFAVVNVSASEKRKGKQPIRSAPSSDTEDVTGFLASRGDRGQEMRQGGALDAYPVSSWKWDKQDVSKRSEESLASVSRTSYSISQPNHNKQLSIITNFSSSKPATTTQSAHAGYSTDHTWVPPEEVHVEPLSIIRRTTTPPNSVPAAVDNGAIPKAQSGSPHLIADATRETRKEADIGFADAGYVDDARVYVDDGYGGMDIEDVGEITFNDSPPSPIWVDSTVDTGVFRGRRKRSTRHYGSPNSSIHQHGSGNIKQGVQGESRRHQGKSNGLSPVGYDRVNLDLELEGEMIFSKNQSPISGLVVMRGKWRSPSPPTPVDRTHRVGRSFAH